MPNNNHKKHYLVALALGPVQDFIAAARRTRDLWFGSFLLSEISKAAALSLHQQAGASAQAGLIFPATDDPDQNLRPCETNLDKEGNPPFNVPNKIMAVIETDQPQAVLACAKEAARKRWLELAGGPFQPDAEPRLSKENIDIELWDEQCNGLLELFAAWVAYDPSQDNYADKRDRLECLLAARKNTRNFAPSGANGDGIPKSSLDGLRESVIAGVSVHKPLKPSDRRRLGLSPGEQLDCPGLVKRLSGKPEQFTPLSRIALDPWLRSLGGPLPDDIIELVKQIHQTKLGLVSRVRGWSPGAFAYDGQLLYPFRIEAERAQVEKLPEEQGKRASQLLMQLQKQLKPLIKQYGEASPYVAILAADGDRMGELISAATSKKQHRKISIALSRYAKKVAAIAQKNYGQLIYAGGDDVLMIVPLDKILCCAKSLEQDFADRWNELDEIVTRPLTHKPTLSVGIGISHMLTPMGRQLALAREAEQIAKANQHENSEQRKNGLAILYQPRSGERITFREQWHAEPEKILSQWQKLHQSQELPFTAAFQLGELGRAIGCWCTPQHPLLAEEIARVLNRKRMLQGGKVDPETIASICHRGAQVGLSKLADELILTQKLATHTCFKHTQQTQEPEHA